MTPDEWDTIALLLHRGFKWKEPFAAAHEHAYQALLDGFEPVQIVGALRVMVAKGQVFGPTPGEIVAGIRRDVSMPTWPEAWQLIRECFQVRARLSKPPEGRSYWLPDEREKLHAEARLARLEAGDIHPLVVSFVRRYGRQDGLEKLRLMNAHDPDFEFAGARLKQLADVWEQHCETMEGREVAAMVAGRSERDGLGRLDPLSALGIGRQELEAGDGS